MTMFCPGKGALCYVTVWAISRSGHFYLPGTPLFCDLLRHAILCKIIGRGGDPLTVTHFLVVQFCFKITCASMITDPFDTDQISWQCFFCSMLLLVGSQMTSLWKKLTVPQVISEKRVLLDHHHRHHHAQNFPQPHLSGLTNAKQTIESEGE